MARDGRELIALDFAYLQLTQSSELAEVRSILAKAEAARLYFKTTAPESSAEARAAELKLRAERKAGALLLSVRRQAGGEGPAEASESDEQGERGITATESKRWQRIAEIPEHDFEQYIRDCRARREMMVASRLLRIVDRAHEYPPPKHTTRKASIPPAAGQREN